MVVCCLFSGLWGPPGIGLESLVKEHGFHLTKCQPRLRSHLGSSHFGSSSFGSGLVQRNGYETPAAMAETTAAECHHFETLATADKHDTGPFAC